MDVRDAGVPLIQLNSGASIPQNQVWQSGNSAGSSGHPRSNIEVASAVVRAALQAGYRHIDTAQMYGTEDGIGEALPDAASLAMTFFITTKQRGNHSPDAVRPSLEQSLAKLHIDHVDLFLMHWPLPTLYDGDFVSTWQAMIDLRLAGLATSIGVSNFQPAHLNRIIEATGVVPAVNQIEMHPRFANDVARSNSMQHGIAPEAWAPLGKGRYLEDPVLVEIASQLNRSVPQVMLRWHIQRGTIVIPKTVHPDRMAENLAIFDFMLSPEAMSAIASLDAGEAGRIGPHPDTFDWVPSADTPNPSH
ncbi:MAG: aldo/keto reductase [Thermomicrobiales bacterium]